MPHGIAVDPEVIKNVLSDYKETGSIYAAAKKNKIHYNTAKKYIDIKSIDKRTSPLASNTTPVIIPELIPDAPIYNIYKKEENIYKDESILNKDINKALSINKEELYIKLLSPIISKMLKRYKKEGDSIPIEKLYLTFGTLFDKYDRLVSKHDINPDSQVIINFYGDDKKVKDMLSTIRESKRLYDK